MTDRERLSSLIAELRGMRDQLDGVRARLSHDVVGDYRLDRAMAHLGLAQSALQLALTCLLTSEAPRFTGVDQATRRHPHRTS